MLTTWRSHITTISWNIMNFCATAYPWIIIPIWEQQNLSDMTCFFGMNAFDLNPNTKHTYTFYRSVIILSVKKKKSYKMTYWKLLVSNPKHYLVIILEVRWNWRPNRLYQQKKTNDEDRLQSWAFYHIHMYLL